MAIKLIFLFFQFAIVCRQCNYAKIDGYYWRDYAGKTPKDALVAGMDYAGNPIYVGLTTNGSNTMTGKLYLDDKTLRYVGCGILYKQTYIKILCSQTPKAFVWVRSGRGQKLPSHLVHGGYQDNTQGYIGRAFYGLETVVGRVVSGTLYVATYQKTFKYLHAYEMLTYQP